MATRNGKDKETQIEKRANGDRMARVFVTTGGSVFTEKDLKKYEIPQSMQLDPIFFRGITVIEPTYDLIKLMSWMETSIAHAACINAKVQDSVGIGWTLKKNDDGKGVESARKKAEDFFNSVNDDEDIIQLSKKLFLDLEGCGNAYMEVARGAKNEIVALYQIPAYTMRLHTSKKLYVQRVAGRTVWFKKFGDEDAIDSGTGEIINVDSKKKDQGKATGIIANEIIHLKQYTWRTPFYGLPDWLPAIYPMFAETKEKDYNLNFFTSFGIPAYAVIMEGMDYNRDVEDAIKKYFNTEIKSNPHSTMVFNTPAGGKMTFEKLNVEAKEASFRVYSRDNRDDILTAHRVPPYRAGIVVKGQLAGGVAAETDRIYLSSVINPKQMKYEWVLTKQIMEIGLGITGWEFIFDDLVIDEKLAKAQVHQIYLGSGVLSPNEVRKELGEDPYQGGDEYASQQQQQQGWGGGNQGADGGGSNTVGVSAPNTTIPLLNDGTPQAKKPAKVDLIDPSTKKPYKKDPSGKPYKIDPKTGKKVFIDPKTGKPVKAVAEPKGTVKKVLGNGHMYDDHVIEKFRRRNGGFGGKIDSLANTHAKAMRKEFSRQGEELLKFFADNGTLEALHKDAQEHHPEAFSTSKRKGEFYEGISKISRRDLDKVNELINGWQDRVKPENVEKLQKEFAKRAGELGGKAGLENLGLNIDFNLKNDKIIQALQERGTKITGGVTEKTLEDFRDILVSRFYEDGASPVDVASDISDLFDETYDGRAETIARTETGIAVSTVQHESYVRNGVQRKQWQSFIDDATRTSHIEADGQEVDMDEPFELAVIKSVKGQEVQVDTEELDHPLDPSGSAGNIINCRCNELPVVTDVINPDEAWTGE